ncbi:MAG TPA: DmsC/YnfH family molybdoenzyme membrane anchor subunit [Pseudomonadales bacterium]
MSVEIYEPIIQKKPSLSLFPVRDNEPAYAKLNDVISREHNCHGNPIQLIAEGPGDSLNINGVDEIGPNPNRNKQHAFHFTADNCIGCHACESACSEKNDLPAHISFRSVGYVEGGTYPNYQRVNISMACNHCDDPVCLKGCPTRAYTKHPEYGAVIQDPNICFGCGYCTWVCPYNAPQLDPIKGQVEKCNMCVDRLEVGLKPACVSACLGNALDFGVTENTPEQRERSDVHIPGFPDPSISKPNIRFQLTRSLPHEVTRTDSMPVKYQKDEHSGQFRPVVDQKAGKARSWNIRRLSSRENPLVIFTLGTQAAVGAFVLLQAGLWSGARLFTQFTASPLYLLTMMAVLGLIALGLLMSTVHLGKPLRFYRGFNNLRHSPVSREGLGIVVFMACVGLHWLASLPGNTWLQSFTGTAPAAVLHISALIASGFAALAVPAGLIALYYMYRCYCIKARPFWNHWHTAASFAGTMLNLGGWLVGLTMTAQALIESTAITPIVTVMAPVIAAGMMLEGIGLWAHARDMNAAEHEGAASHYIQCTTFGNTYALRNGLLALNLIGMLIVIATGISGLGLGLMAATLLASTAAAALMGRALFYVLVIPTTMPGAFFWKNKAFEEHARDIGLANMPQVGVVPLKH